MSTAPSTGPLRVVVFTGGAVLEEDCLEFIARMDSLREFELVGVFCQSRERGVRGVIRDLWRRRRWLAPLLLAQRGLRRSLRFLGSPAAAVARRRALRRLHERLFFVPDLHAGAVLAHVRELEPHVGAVYGGPILRTELYAIPEQGTLGIHHGRLPDYRGKKTTFWAMHNGEDSVGVAIQRIGSGLDRGDVLQDAILRTGRLPLPLVNRRLRALGLDLYLDALQSVQKETAVFRPQPAGRGALYKDPHATDILRFWFRYVRRLFKLRNAYRSTGP